MLSLVRDNADEHIHDPEFQQDMLISVDDALKRMAKVQVRLRALGGEIAPKIKVLDGVDLVKSCCRELDQKMAELTLDLRCPFEHYEISTDPDFFYSILENLLLNSLEAGGKGTRVRISVMKFADEELKIEVSDNGPGIPPDLLPDHLFDPFITAKPTGSGIGLWQVRQLVESLGGKIMVENLENRGARFFIRLPSFHTSGS